MSELTDTTEHRADAQFATSDGAGSALAPHLRGALYRSAGGRHVQQLRLGRRGPRSEHRTRLYVYAIGRSKRAFRISRREKVRPSEGTTIPLGRPIDSTITRWCPSARTATWRVRCAGS